MSVCCLCDCPSYLGHDNIFNYLSTYTRWLQLSSEDKVWGVFVCCISGHYSYFVVAMLCAILCYAGPYYIDGLTHIEARAIWLPFCRRHCKCIFLDEDLRILIQISLKFVPRGPINNTPALVQIMAWCHSGTKPLSEPMLASLIHICKIGLVYWRILYVSLSLLGIMQNRDNVKEIWLQYISSGVTSLLH